VPKINEFPVFGIQIKHNNPGRKYGNIFIEPNLFHAMDNLLGNYTGLALKS
jgi:hypothetical protein